MPVLCVAVGGKNNGEGGNPIAFTGTGMQGSFQRLIAGTQYIIGESWKRGCSKVRYNRALVSSGESLRRPWRWLLLPARFNELSLRHTGWGGYHKPGTDLQAAHDTATTSPHKARAYRWANW